MIAAGVGATVPATVRETVEAVAALASPSGVMALAIAEKLDIDKSNAGRRPRMAADGGYVRNLEDKRGKPDRWVVGDPMPEDADLLPQPRNLKQAADQGGCAVAEESEGTEQPGRTACIADGCTEAPRLGCQTCWAHAKLERNLRSA